MVEFVFCRIAGIFKPQLRLYRGIICTARNACRRAKRRNVRIVARDPAPGTIVIDLVALTFHAHEYQRTALLRVEAVCPGHYELRVLTLVRNCQCSRHDRKGEREHMICKYRNAHKVRISFTSDRQIGRQIKEEADGIAGLSDRVDLFSVLDKGIRVKQALSIQLPHIRKEFLVAFTGIQMLILPIDERHIAAAAVIVNDDIKVRNEIVQEILCAGKRDLVRLSVAVRVLRLKRFQDLIEFVQRRRHLQPELIQPRLIDKRIDPAVAGTAEERKRINVAVRCRNAFFCAGALCHFCLQIGAVLVDQIVERNEHALRAVLVDLIRRQICLIKNIRVFAAVEQKIFLFLDLNTKRRLDIPLDVGLCFDLLPCQAVRKRNVSVHDCKHTECFRSLERERDRIIPLCGLAFILRSSRRVFTVLILRYRRGLLVFLFCRFIWSLCACRHAEQQHGAQQKCENFSGQLFHVVPPLYFAFDFNACCGFILLEQNRLGKRTNFISYCIKIVSCAGSFQRLYHIFDSCVIYWKFVYALKNTKPQSVPAVRADRFQSFQLCLCHIAREQLIPIRGVDPKPSRVY